MKEYKTMEELKQFVEILTNLAESIRPITDKIYDLGGEIKSKHFSDMVEVNLMAMDLEKKAEELWYEIRMNDNEELLE